MGVRVTFNSVLLDSDISFSKASNGYETASFCIKKGNEKYKMILFADRNEQNPYTRMRTCVEKGYLSKGKPIWIEADMSYYEKSVIPEDTWNKLVGKLSKKDIESLFGSTENPSKGKFPRFKVLDWDFAIPKEYRDAGKKTTVSNAEQPQPSATIKPLGDLSRWNGGASA